MSQNYQHRFEKKNKIYTSYSKLSKKLKHSIIIQPLSNQAIFCYTSNRGGGGGAVNLKNKLLRYVYLVPWYSYHGNVSPFSIHTKKVQTYHV